LIGFWKIKKLRLEDGGGGRKPIPFGRAAFAPNLQFACNVLIPTLISGRALVTELQLVWAK
jgi:hypothetical protein